MHPNKIQAKQQQTSRISSSQASSSVHFHYQSGTESSCEMTQSHVTPSRCTRSSFSLPQNGWKHETDLPGGNRQELLSINQDSSQENEVAIMVAQQQGSLGQEEDSDFSYQDQRKPIITAQKSRFSHANNSKETSSDEESAAEGSNNLDETFSYDASKLLKEHAFHSCLTPKPLKDSKPNQKQQKHRQKNIKERSMMKFVKYEVPHEDERRYPYRATRAVPRLKYWQGERHDPVHQGYWKRI